MLSRRSFASLAAVAMLSVPVLAGGSHKALAEDAVDLNKATELVRTVAERGLQDVLKPSVPQDEKIKRFRSLFETYFDLHSAARFVLGRYWRVASEQEQKEFVDLFEDVNIYTWARRFKSYNGEKLVVTGTTPDGPKGAYVTTNVEQTEGKPLVVRWRLRSRPDAKFGFQVVDLEVENVSMAITYRQEYASVIQNHGGSVAALNKMLSQQVDRLKAGQ